MRLSRACRKCAPPWPSRLGKTHIAITLGMEAATRRLSVKFTTAARLVAPHSEARTSNVSPRRLAGFVHPSLLIIDEIGFLPLDAAGASLLFEVVCRRYEKGSIVITSGEWGGIFSGDTMIASAILDRLLHQQSRSRAKATGSRTGRRPTL